MEDDLPVEHGEFHSYDSLPKGDHSIAIPCPYRTRAGEWPGRATVHHHVCKFYICPYKDKDQSCR